MYMKKLMIFVHSLPVIIALAIFLFYFAAVQGDIFRIYENFLEFFSINDRSISRVIFIVYIFLVYGIHIFFFLILMILKNINASVFFISLIILLILPFRLLLVFILGFFYLPICVFELCLLKSLSVRFNLL